MNEELSRIDINGVTYYLLDENTKATAVTQGRYNSLNQRIELLNANNNVVSFIDATNFIKDGMVSNVSIVNGNLIITFNSDAGKLPISIPLTSIFNPSNYYQKSEIDSKFAEKQSEISNLESKIGYYECSSESSSASKTIAESNYVLGNGGSMKVKMTNANTAVNATLNINSTGAKPLFYDGERASANNSWEAGEVVEVFYDGTSFYANNVAGGSSSGVFDVSKKFPTSGVDGGNTYTLELALSVLDANLSSNKKDGGMEIKFVSSIDNKYIQARCMAQDFTTDVTQWQGVDDEVTPRSKNLIESGSVYRTIKDTLPKETEEEGLYICNKEGHVIIRLDVLDSKGGFGENLTAAINALIEAALPEQSSIIKDVLEDGFYICNEDGKAIAKFIDDKWELLGLDATVAYESGVAIKSGNMSNGTEWVISNNAVKHDKRLLFSGKITSFNSLMLGHGKISNGEANWIEITTTNIIEHFVNSGNAEYTGYPKTTPHGLTIENNIQVEIVQDEQSRANVTVVSSGHSFKLNNITWFGSSGDVYVSSTSTLTDCSLGWTCAKIKSGIWLFGDSYFSVTDVQRWTSYLFQNGYNNFMLNAFPGEESATAWNNLTELLKIDTPKEIVWCMGMNNPDTENAVNVSWKSKLDDVIAICEEKGIELILATIPTAVGLYNSSTQTYTIYQHKWKNATVKASGYRYIDFASAVGASDVTGEWFNNGQADDMLEAYGQAHSRIHPTSYGALALYHQAIADCPELTR